MTKTNKERIENILHDVAHLYCKEDSKICKLYELLVKNGVELNYQEVEAALREMVKGHMDIAAHLQQCLREVMVHNNSFPSSAG